MIRITRREVLGSLAAVAALPKLAVASTGQAVKVIPKSGENLPVIGMGSWITFNVGRDRSLRDQRAEVLRAFFAAGGGAIDSSPMYGSSEEVIGYCLDKLSDTSGLFSATKVWTPLTWHGEGQMEDSEALWGLKRFDLMQVHNLLNLDGHMETLVDWKSRGRIRYIGITTSHGRRHAELERAMNEQPVDFAQFTYNIVNREAERRLLPAAADLGIATIINRPFGGGRLVNRFEKYPLPEWAPEIDCRNWPQFLLKFIVSHPAVSCAIPATSRVDHINENMGAGQGTMPDAKTRKMMIDYVEAL